MDTACKKLRYYPANAGEAAALVVVSAAGM
jgi:hypothetical protein